MNLEELRSEIERLKETLIAKQDALDILRRHYDRVCSEKRALESENERLRERFGMEPQPRRET